MERSRRDALSPGRAEPALSSFPSCSRGCRRCRCPASGAAPAPPRPSPKALSCGQTAGKAELAFGRMVQLAPHAPRNAFPPVTHGWQGTDCPAQSASGMAVHSPGPSSVLRARSGCSWRGGRAPAPHTGPAGASRGKPQRYTPEQTTRSVCSAFEKK